MIAERRGGTYVSLDDEAELEIALADPVTFLLARRHPLVVDEVQLGGDRVVRALKQVVDAEATPGRFVLAGSTNFLTVPTISESLAGRVQIFRLWPLSQAELAGVDPSTVDGWFNETSGSAGAGAPPVMGIWPWLLGRLSRGVELAVASARARCGLGG